MNEPLQDPALDPDGVCPECSGLRKPCTACNSTGLLSVAYSMAKGQIRMLQAGLKLKSDVIAEDPDPDFYQRRIVECLDSISTSLVFISNQVPR
jgi:hypothetical protein